MLDPLSIPNIPLVGVSDAPSSKPVVHLLRPTQESGVYDLHMDNTTLEKFTICSRKSLNYSILSRQRAYSTSPQDFGTLFHECESLRLLHGLSPAVISRQHEAVANHFLCHVIEPDDHRTADRMLSILKLYNERYAHDGWPENVLSIDGKKLVEIPFKVPFCEIPVNAELPYPSLTLLGPVDGMTPTPTLHVKTIRVYWTGRIDAVVRENNLEWVVDHKTSSSGGSELIEGFHLASQTMGYSWAYHQLTGRRAAGAIINLLIIRPPAKTARAQTPREEFTRHPFFYTPDQLTEWFHSTSYIIADFVSCVVRGFFPMSGPKSFRSPCPQCDYHENCRLPLAQRSFDLTFPSYRDVTWDPLTSE